MRKLHLLVASALLVFNAFGQEKDQHIKGPTLAIQLGAFDFKTPMALRNNSLGSVLANKQWSKASNMDMALGLSFIKGITNHLDYSVNAYLGSLNYPFREGVAPSLEDHLLTEIDASAHLKLLTDKYIVVPYLSAGVGGSMYKGKVDAFMPLGGGLQFRLGKETFAFSNFQYRVPVTQRANYHFLYSIGVGTSVGKPKKEVVKVAPPPPPPPPPADTDGDGIVDPQDKCPTVPGVAKYQGCPVPDTDGDGINDDNDKCPTVAGTAKYQGCPVPDTDGDGLNDEEDKCPTVAGLTRYQGCPIPDTDGDGINDEEDKCPTVPGVAENAGCPAVKFTPENVLFNTGSAVLQTRGKKELDIVLAFAKEHPSLNFLVEGHTDNTGSASLNKSLSLKRANSAKAYLVSKGVDASRFETVGYGAERPIADNKTAAGRTKNRRVDFVLKK